MYDTYFTLNKDNIPWYSTDRNITLFWSSGSLYDHHLQYQDFCCSSLNIRGKKLNDTKLVVPPSNPDHCSAHRLRPDIWTSSRLASPIMLHQRRFTLELVGEHSTQTGKDSYFLVGRRRSGFAQGPWLPMDERRKINPGLNDRTNE